jgi:diguanylate cyclase (GGDEF)-like protein
MTVLESSTSNGSRQENSVLALDAPSELLPLELDEQILRIQRIGKRTFDAANCLVVINGDQQESDEDEQSQEALERAFCTSLPVSDGAVFVPDTRIHALTKKHRFVIGAPHIQFFASCPVHSVDRAVIGSINLIDYVPRAFDSDDQALLADLACLVERELQLRSMSVAQLALQKKNRSLRRRSLIDPLIGTWNRGAIMRILEIESIRCEKMGIPLSLAVIDLDHFKKINDTHGHPAGDAVLVKAASRMRSCIRPQEALGRYGGEEFLVVLPGASLVTAQAVAERMRATIAAQAEQVGDVTINLSISAGVASSELFPQASSDELINRADIALYQAKDGGRNRVVCATAD